MMFTPIISTSIGIPMNPPYFKLIAFGVVMVVFIISCFFNHNGKTE